VHPIPVFVNASAGGAGPVLRVLRVLRADPRVRVCITPPAQLASALQNAVARGDGSVIVAGGDGTLATAATVLAGRDVVLGVVPAGTLNHFAHDQALPMDPAAALEVALNGRTARIDAARVNETIFLNTSAVGAYPAYVRTRRRWAPWLGYYGASVVAAVRTFVHLHSLAVDVEVRGELRRYRSPLVFVGVGERELHRPRLGARRDAGRRELHVLIVRHTTRPRLLWMVLRTLLRGIRPWAGEDEVESLLVDRCTITLPPGRRWIAVDGEIIPSSSSLRYRYQPDALTVRLPERASEDRPSGG
jgi:diacylglycerol kinase family enzyme